MAGLTSTGFEIKTLEQVESEMDDTLHSTISPTLNLTSTSAFGQLKSVTASHTSEVWDAALALYMSWDADSATGAALDRLGALTGTYRRPATSSTAVMQLSLLAGTYEAGELVVSKVGDGTVRFENPAEIVLASDNASYQVTFVSQETGAVAAATGELSVIEPVDGFVSATNISSAVQGKPTESDTDYRRRRALELALKGSTTVDAIRADMLQVQADNDADGGINASNQLGFWTLSAGGTLDQAGVAIRVDNRSAHAAQSTITADYFLVKPTDVLYYYFQGWSELQTAGNGGIRIAQYDKAKAFIANVDLKAWTAASAAASFEGEIPLDPTCRFIRLEVWCDAAYDGIVHYMTGQLRLTD